MENLEIKKYKNINKNPMDAFNNKMEKTEERINVLKDKTIEITQSELGRKADWKIQQLQGHVGV